MSQRSHRLYCGLGARARLTLTGLPKSHIIPALKKFVVRGRLTSAGPSPVPLGGRNLVLATVRLQVDVKSILDLLGFRHLLEKQSNPGARSRLDENRGVVLEIGNAEGPQPAYLGVVVRGHA
jgi:hypothetical protein